MNLVLLSGGSGKRLWPLSNDARSKQFLKLLKNNEDDQSESMLQRVWKQLHKSGLSRNAIIATSKSQEEIMYNQLGSEITLVTEPYRRDTFPAIALAASYLYSEKKIAIDESVTVLPVDPYVDDLFFEKIRSLEDILTESRADLALVGVKPIFPSQKYGYIVPETSGYQNNMYVPVKSFKEKPDLALAKELISEEALWNCGVFSFRLSFILDYLKELNIPTDYKVLVNNYDMLPKISFDYEIVERAKNIVVAPYNGYWKDLGTWNTLTEEMSSNIVGKGVISDELKNSNIINELQIPIVLMGLENAIVAASPDGILVTDKDRSPDIKKYAEMFSDRPMFEERRWGWYKVLEHNKYEEGNQVLTRRLWVESGKNISYQIHYQRTEVWTLIKGEGLLILENSIEHVRAGDTIKIPLGKKHALKAITNMEIIEVQVGNNITEDDVTRIAYDWNEIIDKLSITVK
ncbi:sugar phosphate nucleotidyltransferase [Terribacillus sp. FSL K6-0262]|uniref:sugar phosphate nucleotidyltransferase n=1 Tax=Terribacillus sp. FSL K6-0262 TaxID=2921447 RepID=UPI0030EC04B4